MATGALGVGMVGSLAAGGLFSYPWIVLGVAGMGSTLGTALSARQYGRTVGAPTRLGTAAVVCVGGMVLGGAIGQFEPLGIYAETGWTLMALSAFSVLPLAALQGHVASRQVWEASGAASPWPWASLHLGVVPGRDGGGRLVASLTF